MSAGAVYVFRRTAGVWSQEAYVKPSNTRMGESFGSSVALNGETLAVGAPSEGSCATGINGDQTDSSCGSAGAVYVFTRTAGVWTQQAYVKASNTEFLDGFGSSVSITGDTLAVGAPFEKSCAMGLNGDQSNNGCSEAGAVYVFTRTAGSWRQQTYVKASNTGANDRFGFSVTLSGDTLAVGAPGEGSSATGVNGNQADDGCLGAGAVYVFTQKSGGWSQQAYVKASNTRVPQPRFNPSDEFGFSVALLGDTLAVGARKEASCATGINGNQADSLCFGAGAVYVYAAQ